MFHVKHRVYIAFLKSILFHVKHTNAAFHMKNFGL